MRSEERAGIVAIILLLLWGTLVTEPFHVFTEYLYGVLNLIQVKVGINTGTVIHSFMSTILLTGLCLGLLLLSRVKAAYYIPCGLFCFTGITLLARIIKNKEFYVKDAVVIIVSLIVIAIVQVTPFRKVLLWISDFLILSIPIFLLTALVTKPLGKLGNVIDNILYINNHQSVDLSTGFSGVFGLPSLLWGGVLFVLVALPVVYNCLSKRCS